MRPNRPLEMLISFGPNARGLILIKWQSFLKASLASGAPYTERLT